MSDSKKTDRDMNAMLRILIEALPDIVVFKDTEGRHVLVNKATEEFTGLAAGEIIGKTMEDLAPSELAAACRRSDEAALKSDIPIRTMELSHGGKVVLDTIKAPIHDRDGKLLGLVAVSRDITQQKKTEDDLRQSQKFINDVLEAVDEGFMVIDREYKIISANRAYLCQVAKPLENVIGSHCYEVSHQSQSACHELGEECPAKQTFETGEPYKALHIHHDENDDPIYVEVKTFGLKDDAGTVHSVIEIVNNITDKKKLEDQLRHAQKLEAVGQLAGGIAHDFNNILTAIIGYGYLIKSKIEEGKPTGQDIDHILSASEQGASLIRGLLAFSRKEPVTMSPLNLTGLLGGTDNFLRRIMGEDIEMQLDLADKEMIIMADSGQIHQVLVNLAANARDAMPDGGRLSIASEIVELDQDFIITHGYGTSGTYALLTVSDTGVGMDEETREKLFDPFFTTKEVGKGTGLGMSIVYGIVKQHGGYINCYSEPGLGTTFRIYLPLVKDAPYRAKPLPVPHVSGGTETILLAEDENLVRMLLSDALRINGYAVITAEDGQEAIRKYWENRDRIKLLLFDLVMPGKSGKDACEEIMKDRPDIKAIIMSGYANDTLRKKGIENEKMSFLSKPISPDNLLRKVRDLIDSD